MKITKFDKATATQVGNEVAAAMKAIAEKYGLTVKAGGGRFGDSSFKPRTIEFAVQTEGGSSKKDEDTWKNLAGMYGLDASLLGRVFTVRGETFRVDGLAPGRSKNCVNITRMRDMSPRRCPPNFVKAGVFAPVTA